MFSEENRCLATPEPCPYTDCVDTRAGPVCVCPDGYALTQESACLHSSPAYPHLLVANSQVVRDIDTLFGTSEVGIRGFVSAVVLAYDGLPGNEAVYVSDSGTGTIKRYDTEKLPLVVVLSTNMIEFVGLYKVRGTLQITLL